MAQAKAAYISFGFFAYPKDFIVNQSRAIFGECARRGLDAEYFGPVIDGEDAERVLGELAAKRFDFVIAHITTWTTSPVAIRVLREFRHLPLLVWGMGGKTEDGTLISPASPAGASALLHSLRQMDIPYRYVYDHPDAEPKYAEVLEFASVVSAVKALNGAKVGAMGYCDMGLYSLMLDGVALKRQLGMDVEDIFSAEVAQLAAEAPKADVEAVVDEMRHDLEFPSPPSYEQLEKTARLTVALRKKVAERGYLGVTMKCVYGVSRYMGFTPCLAQALLSKDVCSICESDAAGLVTEVILKQLTGLSSTFMENYEYYPDRVLVGVCGFAPFDMTQGARVRCMCAGWGGFTGIYETPDMKEGRITIARLYSEAGRLKMLLTGAEGTVPGRWAELGWAEPMPKFPSLMLKLDCPVDFYVEHCVSQHINIVYGDARARVREFCRLTGIDVVEYK